MATLNSNWMYVGTSSVMTSASGLKYYLLLFAKTNGNQTTGIHKVSILGRLASASRNATFYKYETSYSGKINGSSAFSGTGEPNAAWEFNTTTTPDNQNGVNYYTYTDIASGSVDVDCTDGLSKAINVSFTWSMPSNDSASYTPPSGTSRTVSANVTLPAIPRAATPTLSKSTVKMGEKVTIYTNRKSTALTCDLYLVKGSTRHTIKIGVQDSFEWTVDDLAHLCNDATSFSGSVECKTFTGSAAQGWTLIGTKSVDIKLTVPDATVPSFPNGDVIIGGVNPITTNAGSANFTHLITYAFGNETGQVDEKKKSGIVWYPSYDLAKWIPNNTIGEGSISCKTYNGTALVGEKPILFRAILPENSITRPSFNEDGFVLIPEGRLSSVFDGLYIQGKKGVKAEFTASSPSYSNIASYKLSVDGRVYTGNPATSYSLAKDGNIEVIGTVTDTRGFSTHVQKSISVIPYSIPKIEPYDGDKTIICERSDQSGVYTPSGTHLHIRAKRSYYPVFVNGTQKNFCHLKYRYKASGGSWSAEKTLLEGTDTSTDKMEIIISDVVAEIDKTYLVQLIVEDTIGEKIYYDFPISTDKVTLHLGEGGHGVSVGKYSEATADNEMFECNWRARFYDAIYAQKFIKVAANGDEIEII